MNQALDIQFETGIRLLARELPAANKLIKPTLLHSIRVGLLLMEKNYSDEVVLAGLLHDSLEDTNIPVELLTNQFGTTVAQLVQANTKDNGIAEYHKRNRELITRCIKTGEQALIIKAADILDNYAYSIRTGNTTTLQHCYTSRDIILELLPDKFSDPLFAQLKSIIQ